MGAAEAYIEPVTDRFTPATLAEIERIEQLMGARLPKFYADFLRKFGPCMFHGHATIADREGERYEVHTLFGALGDDVHSVEYNLQRHPEYRRGGFVPIADDRRGNRYLMDVRRDGAIHFMDQDVHHVRGYRIAESFEDFLGRIEVQP